MSSRTALSRPEEISAPPISNARLGIILFVASEVMLFAGLIVGFVVLRYGSNNFQGMPKLPIGLTAISTPLLLASSLTLYVGHRGLAGGKLKVARYWTLATLLLGIAFLAIQVVEWEHLVASGMLPQDSVHGGMFYLLSGIHGLHVLGGIILLAVFTWRLFSGSVYQTRQGIAVASSVYWHFVDVMWLALFLMIFIL
jgi:cytochrome c oxidase subunit 3